MDERARKKNGWPIRRGLGSSLGHVCLDYPIFSLESILKGWNSVPRFCLGYTLHPHKLVSKEEEEEEAGYRASRGRRKVIVLRGSRNPTGDGGKRRGRRRARSWDPSWVSGYRGADVCAAGYVGAKGRRGIIHTASRALGRYPERLGVVGIFIFKQR